MSAFRHPGDAVETYYTSGRGAAEWRLVGSVRKCTEHQAIVEPDPYNPGRKRFRCTLCGQANYGNWNGRGAELTTDEGAAEIAKEQIPKPLRLNLGAGQSVLPGYVNVDLGYISEPVDDPCEAAWAWSRQFRSDQIPEKVGGAVHPLPVTLKDKAEVIRASHVLEHFPQREVPEVIADWVGALKPGGWLKVAVPNFQWIVERYLEDSPENLRGFLMGGQTDERDFHKSVFDPGILNELLEQAGLVDIQPWESELRDCAALPVSLNLMGMKPGDVPCDPDLPKPVVAAVALPTTPFAWLGGHVRNKYSQQGEDGILEAIFARIGTENRYAIECGAGDPDHFSNTRKLIEEGWGALLIEKDHTKWNKLWGRYKDRPNDVRAIKADVGWNALDETIANNARQSYLQPDLLILDVDGQEYHLWNSLMRYRPRVVVCEVSLLCEPDFVPEIGGPGQAGPEAIETLGAGKGYTPIALVGTNLFFVLNELAGKLEEAAEPAPIQIKAGEIAAIMACPRLAFTDNMFCALKVLSPLGITLERRGGVFWGQSMTDLIRPHLEDGHTEFILSLDYDSVYTQEDLFTLLRIMKTRPEIDALAPIQIGRDRNTPLFAIGKENGGAWDCGPRQIAIPWETLRADTMQVATAHFGLTLLRIEALKRLPLPWFTPQPAPDLTWGEGRQDPDIHFWHEWRKCGNTLHVANRVVIGHLQNIVSWPDRHLTGAIHQYFPDYSAKGKSPLAWR